MVEALKELRAEVTALEPADGSVSRAAPASPQPAAATPMREWTQQICLTHVYFGAVETSYPYMDYVLESMRYNKKNVKFVILNVKSATLNLIVVTIKMPKSKSSKNVNKHYKHRLKSLKSNS